MQTSRGKQDKFNRCTRCWHKATHSIGYFDELSQPEKDKDAIFLAFVWLAKRLAAPQTKEGTIDNEK